VVRHVRRHARRLRRDAAALGLEAPGEEMLVTALRALGREAFGAGAGVVRLAVRPGPGGPAAAIQAGSTRALGAEPALWRAILFSEPHPGNCLPAGAKREGAAIYEAARAAALRAGADEALLVDARGLLVEGARTSIFVVRRDGALVTPPLGSGAVAGVAREIVLERVLDAHEDDVPLAALAEAEEVVLVNAVRGAVRLSELDGRPLGRLGSAAWTERLRALLLSDPAPAGLSRK